MLVPMETVIASAQIRPEPENLAVNLEKHIMALGKASERGAGFILFPEMSLTGYEREFAPAQALAPGDVRLSALRDAARSRGIVAAVGAPVAVDGNLHIGTLVFLPSGDILIYAKQYLHPGEETVFSPSFAFDPVVGIGEEKISFAVCFDIENGRHPEKAHARGSTLYAAGIFYSPAGIEGAHRTLSGYASKYSMNVVMSNFCGSCREWRAGGRSAIWNNAGGTVVEADADGDMLLLARKTGGGWAGERIRLD